MTEPELFKVAGTTHCEAIMFEPWDSQPGRFFVAYRARHGFNAMLGNGVVDEFRTISGPVLLAPSSILGGVYDAGLRLADARDHDAPIDQGWPPLVIGIDVDASERADDWIAQLLDAIQEQRSTGPRPWKNTMISQQCGEYRLQILRCSVVGRQVVTIIATDAPMLPQQLERLSDVDAAPITIAVSVGNRLPRVVADEYHQIDVISEQQLAALVAGAELITS